MSNKSIVDHLTRQFHLPEDEIKSLMPSFIATVQKHMSCLEDAVGEKDALLVGKAAHRIKGAFLNLGLNDCARLATEIEEQAERNGGSEDWFPVLGKLRQQVDAALE